MIGYKEPHPSLCDSCGQAYVVSAGFTKVGDHLYRLRYCPVPLKEGGADHRLISWCGYDYCNFYMDKSKHQAVVEYGVGGEPVFVFKAKQSLWRRIVTFILKGRGEG